MALSALVAALGQQLPLPVPSVFDLFPISQPWIRLDFLKLLCLFPTYHSFLSKHQNLFLKRPAASYPLVQLTMAASRRLAENIGLHLAENISRRN